MATEFPAAGKLPSSSSPHDVIPKDTQLGSFTIPQAQDTLRGSTDPPGSHQLEYEPCLSLIQVTLTVQTGSVPIPPSVGRTAETLRLITRHMVSFGPLS
ncbi:uncharacterized [Tachysurus ichikawai]